jgi:hypothetical protein
MPAAKASMRAKESVSIRATVAGMTSVAAMSVTPSTCIVARIEAARMTMSRASTRAVSIPEASATSGSKVAKSRER